MSPTTIAAMELQQYLRGIDYPCSKEDVLAAAVHAGAPVDLLHRLHAIPVSGFSNPVEVSQHVARLNGGML